MGETAAAIVGYTEWKPQRRWPKPMFGLEAMAQLAAETLADAGFEKPEIDGIVFGSVPELPIFAPAAVAVYLGLQTAFNEGSGPEPVDRSDQGARQQRRSFGD